MIFPNNFPFFELKLPPNLPTVILTNDTVQAIVNSSFLSFSLLLPDRLCPTVRRKYWIYAPQHTSSAQERLLICLVTESAQTSLPNRSCHRLSTDPLFRYYLASLLPHTFLSFDIILLHFCHILSYPSISSCFTI